MSKYTHGRQNKRIRLAVLAITIWFNISFGQAQPGSLPQRIDSLFMDCQKPNVPSVAIAVVQRGRLLYSHHFGMANLQTGQPIDSLTQFWVASVTKQFTAAGIYLLVTQRKLNVHQSIRRYLPELPALFQPVTIDQLLHHTSGIRDGFVLTALAKKSEADYTNQNVLAYLCQQQQFNFEPGTEYEYNNSGYVLLALVIERVTSQTFPAFIQKHLFVPLGMNHTLIAGQYQPNKTLAKGYRQEGGTYTETHFLGNTYGSTGIITTLPDLARWEIVIQHPERFGPFKEVIAQMLTPGKRKDGRLIAYGGGLEKFSYQGRTVYEHFGADPGFKANLIYIPQAGLSIIGLTNNADNHTLSEKLYALADLWLQTPKRSVKPFKPEPSLGSSLYYSGEGQPMFRQVTQFSTYITIKDTPTGYAAIYYPTTSGTYESSDPLPTRYQLSGDRTLTLIDPYYHQGKSLTALKKVSTIDDLQALTGTYLSTELQTSYEIQLKDNQLWLVFAPGVQFPLVRLTATDFIVEYVGGNYLSFNKNGFAFSRDGCRRLTFVKQTK
ncbi:beta-lactamase family protein [Spirosoma sp. BT702]|uniref:Beta-lactamase family protein n=1 Tax=Spirosoma profusum TaxID=2771354 RepID=A0A927ATG5_9BACT|nr:serine hydrolase domain-containing protein [Spirosoma profusum]MBD2703455.1 beta-lactamase family protein [Spirosoma profusum]